VVHDVGPAYARQAPQGAPPTAGVAEVCLTSCRHRGNCAATNRRTVETETDSWSGCITTATPWRGGRLISTVTADRRRTAPSLPIRSVDSEGTQQRAAAT
jgi:hypothetical protein